MFKINVEPSTQSDFERIRRYSRQVTERAFLRGVAHVASRGKIEVRRAFSGAGLGRLGNAIGSRSDAETGKVHRFSNGAFSVSAGFYAKTRNERTLGALESYTKGSEISPLRGRWLWIATDEIPRLTARERMTPERYVRNGFEQKIGPLHFVKSVNGNPLLVVQDASVSAVGKPRSAKSRTKRGALRKGQRAKEFIVAFVGIPRTSRSARVDIRSIINEARSQMPSIIARELETGGR